MLKIATIGAKGMLGTDFTNFSNSIGHEVLGFDLPSFDICDRDCVQYAVASADIVANFAAYTDVDGAESEKDLCFAVNTYGVGVLSEECAKASKYLLHVSTDFVFGDKSLLPLKETDEPAPLNNYGASKLEGEKLVIKNSESFGILRLEWTYGHYGKNFILKVLLDAKKNGKLKVVDDQFGSPTWTIDASRAVLAMIQASARGVYHFAPRGYVSRWDLAKFAIEEAGIDAEILRLSSSGLKNLAKRPLNSRFDCSKIDGILPYQRPEWRESLSIFIAELKSRGVI